MKKALAVLMSMAVTSFGAMLQEGTRELGLAGSLDIASADGTAIDLSASYGYFIADGLEIGVSGFWADSDSVTSIGLGAFAEYHFATDSNLVPYVGVGAGWGKTEIDIGDFSADDDALVIAGEAGVKYFFVENIAISLAYVFEWATEDIFFDDDKAEDTDHSIQLGMRFYF